MGKSELPRDADSPSHQNTEQADVSSEKQAVHNETQAQLEQLKTSIPEKRPSRPKSYLKIASHVRVGNLAIDRFGYEWKKVNNEQWECFHEDNYNKKIDNYRQVNYDGGMDWDQPVAILPASAHDAPIDAIIEDSKGKHWKHVFANEWEPSDREPTWDTNDDTNLYKFNPALQLKISLPPNNPTIRRASRCPIGAVCITVSGTAYAKNTVNRWGNNFSNLGITLLGIVAELPPGSEKKPIGTIVTDLAGLRWKRLYDTQWALAEKQTPKDSLPPREQVAPRTIPSLRSQAAYLPVGSIIIGRFGYEWKKDKVNGWTSQHVNYTPVGGSSGRRSTVTDYGHNKRGFAAILPKDATNAPVGAVVRDLYGKTWKKTFPHEWEFSEEEPTWECRAGIPKLLDKPLRDIREIGKGWTKIGWENVGRPHALKTGFNPYDDSFGNPPSVIMAYDPFEYSGESHLSDKKYTPLDEGREMYKWHFNPTTNSYSSSYHEETYDGLTHPNLQLDINEEFTGLPYRKEGKPPSRCTTGTMRIDNDGIAWEKLGSNEWRSLHEEYTTSDRNPQPRIIRANAGMEYKGHLTDLIEGSNDAPVGAVVRDTENREWKQIRKWEWKEV